jgi:hypothetical protein
MDRIIVNDQHLDLSIAVIRRASGKGGEPNGFSNLSLFEDKQWRRELEPQFRYQLPACSRVPVMTQFWSIVPAYRTNRNGPWHFRREE